MRLINLFSTADINNLMKNCEKLIWQSFRGAYHTIVLGKVSKKTTFFLFFFNFKDE